MIDVPAANKVSRFAGLRSEREIQTTKYERRMKKYELGIPTRILN